MLFASLWWMSNWSLGFLILCVLLTTLFGGILVMTKDTLVDVVDLTMDEVKC